MRYRVVLAVMIGLVLLGQREVNGQTTDNRPVGKIAVTARGAVSFDGMAITLDALSGKLADLRRRNGVVWYYREAAAGEPPAQATEVMKLIIGHGLPVSMSTRPDYSDVLLPDGTTRPRTGAGRR